MKVVNTVKDLRFFLKGQTSVGFVPTMGALHDGHLSLIKGSKRDNLITVVSIFVNPTQFNDETDFKNYPIMLGQDIALLEDLDVDYLFCPSSDEIYPDKYTYRLIETDLANRYCGRSRPGHFDGVLTIVLKLFNIVRPNRVYFGQKDYQQMILIKGMIAALFLDIELVAMPTVYQNGLALSSRNKLLSDGALQRAKRFASILSEGRSIDDILQKLKSANINVDYVEEFDGRILAAVKIDNVRLIDNVAI
jgi:pantoate--beta-alanine ligase